MKQPTQRLRGTAYHEAGHAGVAIHFRIPINVVTIVPGDDHLGFVERKWERHDRKIREGLEFAGLTPALRTRLENRVMMLYAGECAQRKSGTRVHRFNLTSDSDAIGELISRTSASEEEIEAYARWLHIRTVNLVNRLWFGVEAVAQTLLQRQTLTGDEAKQVITEAQAQFIEQRNRIVEIKL